MGKDDNSDNNDEDNDDDEEDGEEDKEKRNSTTALRICGHCVGLIYQPSQSPYHPYKIETIVVPI